MWRNPDRNMTTILVIAGVVVAGVVVATSMSGKTSGIPDQVRRRALEEANTLQGKVKNIWKDALGWIAEIEVMWDIGFGGVNTYIVRLFGIRGLKFICLAAANDMSRWQVDKSVSITPNDAWNWDLFRQHSRSNLGCDPGSYPVVEFVAFGL